LHHHPVQSGRQERAQHFGTVEGREGYEVEYAEAHAEDGCVDEEIANKQAGQAHLPLKEKEVDV
jgi:hypothetical protein